MSTDESIELSHISNSPSPRPGHSPSPSHEVSKTGSTEPDPPSAPPELTNDSVQNPDVYFHGWTLALTMIAAASSIFLIALDQTILATAIPQITDDFNSLDQVAWYGATYLLTASCMQLLYGRFYTFLDIKWTYLGAIFIFEVGSLICGIAPTSITLIIGRAIAGIGNAGIFSGTMIVISRSVALEKRAIFTGIIGAAYGLASVAGPLLGGAFTTKATWRWCFYINLPIGGIALAILLVFLKLPKVDSNIPQKVGWRGRVNQFDIPGSITIIPAVVCLLLAMQWGGSSYAWDSWRELLLLILSGVLFVAFGIIQVYSGKRATVPIHLLKERAMLSAMWFSFTLFSGYFMFLYYLPIWFQAIQGQSALDSGVRNIPTILAVVLSTMVAGAVITRTGYYNPWMIFASVMASIGAGLLTTLNPSSGANQWIGYQVIFGLGAGSGLQQSLLAVQNTFSLEDVPTATSVILFLQQLGAAIFLSVGENVFNSKLRSGIESSCPGLDPEAVLHQGATDIQKSIPEIYRECVTNSYNDAVTATFLVGTVMVALSILGSATMRWKSMKGKKAVMAG